MTTAWYEREVTRGERLHWQLGSLDLWVDELDGEWRVAVGRASEEREVTVDDTSVPDGIDLRRWMTCARNDRLRVTPVMPDRSVIVRPQSPVQILPGCEALFFLSIPVWIKVSIHTGKGTTLDLFEEYTIRLSNSWFGLPTEGELCYALRSRARRSLGEHPPAPYRVICPLLIKNGADKALNFERLCLRCRHLNIYQGNKNMWTNHITLVQNKEGELTNVTYGKGAPDYDGAGNMLSAARVEPGRGFMLRAFDNFKAIGFL